jgi:MoaA/NifB/PqqE/SkfB family radical SAM enzyme
MVARGLGSTRHPMLAHIIPMRRCNLACTYCNEYDNHSPPVPTGEVSAWVDKLAELGTSVITISGGEPLMHPDIEKIIARIRRHGMIAGLITNGYFLMPEKIRALNDAGLDHLQISIDNIEPDVVSVKSLRVLRKKLEFLAEYAAFDVNINSVIGGGIRNPEDALAITEVAQSLGFSTSLGIIHDGSGQLKALNTREERVYRKIRSYGSRGYAGLNWFQENLARGRPNVWRCRAGARYLYICENGLVHYCSQQRGYPGIPLAEYTPEDIRREFHTAKSCAPACTIGCVQKVSMTDHWRAPQNDAAFLPLQGRSEL